MKKKFILLALLFLVCLNAIAYDVDVIITKSREQIQCLIISQDDDNITYTDLNDKRVYQIAKSDVEKIYMHATEPTQSNKAEKAVPTPKKEALSQPITEHASESKSNTMDDTEFKRFMSTFKSPDELAQKPANPEGKINTKATQQYGKDVARVDQFSGVYVFTDCVPLSTYEVLGEVNSAKNSSMSFFEETPQYTNIRDQLITNAVLASRQVEGIILKLPKAGEGTALMIKFKNPDEDHALARVNHHLGILVFMDNKPIQPYSFVGEIKNIGGLDPDYNALRDKLIRKSTKKFKSTEAVIPHLVSGGFDSGEAIKF